VRPAHRLQEDLEGILTAATSPTTSWSSPRRGRRASCFYRLLDSTVEALLEGWTATSRRDILRPGFCASPASSLPPGLPELRPAVFRGGDSAAGGEHCCASTAGEPGQPHGSGDGRLPAPDGPMENLPTSPWRPGTRGPPAAESPPGKRLAAVRAGLGEGKMPERRRTQASKYRAARSRPPPPAAPRPSSRGAGRAGSLSSPSWANSRMWSAEVAAGSKSPPDPPAAGGPAAPARPRRAALNPAPPSRTRSPATLESGWRLPPEAACAWSAPPGRPPSSSPARG